MTMLTTIRTTLAAALRALAAKIDAGPKNPPPR